MAELKHYGTPRRSGRYPWGSGEDPYQREPSLRNRVNELQEKGLSETEIAEGLGFDSTTQLRAELSSERAAQRQADATFALRLKDKGYSDTAIAERLGVDPRTVKSLLDPATQERTLITEKTADMLRRQVEDKKYVDVGAGSEYHAGVTRHRLDLAIKELEKDGYKLQYVTAPQPGGKKTYIKVLTKDDVDYKTELWPNRDQIRTISEWTNDGGRNWLGLEPITNVSSKRIVVNFAEDGGKDKDGVIELRRGVADLSLGDARYGQVRVGVEGSHYLKGMAMYADDLPDGVDIRYNTNKPKGTPIMGKKDNTVFKVMEDDPDNPFGTDIRQYHYKGKDGKDYISALNVVGVGPSSNVEGAWLEWSNTLSSQMLSKQKPQLAKEQLDLAVKMRQEEFNEYKSLTNPTIKQKLLLTFADSCDSDAVDLKAAAMPRQANHVLLPAPHMKPTEIYAPNYTDGINVVLIRHPHGGIFEIPQLKVNNKDPKMKSLLGNARDAVAVHPDVAQKLSGADFDGDTVLVIPNNSKKITIAPSIKALADFDPKISYPGVPGMKRMTTTVKEVEMGKISNLITDMTIKGADQDEIARAVRHSMVVIDAEKHGLNYKQSYKDNGIAQLKIAYQGGPRKGATTIVSRASSTYRIPHRKDYYKIDKKTGKKIFIPDPQTYVNKDGQTVERKTKSTYMYETDDAFTLSSGTVMETLYANYANSMKAMGDEARKLAVNTPDLNYSPSAYKTYSKEVEALKSKLALAKSNKPLERQALLLADSMYQAKKQANPDLSKKQLKKIKGMAIVEARSRVGAKKQRIPITEKEWEAIQAGAVSNNFLKQILNNTELDLIKQYATPRAKQTVSNAKIAKARILFDRGYTQAEVAKLLGLPVTTLMDAVNNFGDD
jgi:predicted transcriptional regulator